MCSFAVKNNNIESYLNQRCGILRNFKKINHIYFMGIYKSNIQKYINSNLCKGSNQDNISLQDIININIPVPLDPHKIQFWTDKISEPYYEKQTKEVRIKELEKKIQDSITEITKTEDCEEVELGDVCDFVNGKKRKTTEHKNNGIYPLFSSSLNIDNWIDEYDYDEDCLIINTINGSGNFNIHYSNRFCATSNTIIFKTDYINIKYIFYYCIMNLKIINSLANGSTKKKMGKAELSKFKIKIPENKQLIEDMEPTFQEIELLQEEVKNADTLYHQYIEELGQEAIKQ